MYQEKNLEKKIWFVTALFLFSFAALSYGAKDKSKTEGKIDNLRSANKLMGKDIKNNQGEKIGKVEELLVDNNTKTVYYVILSSDGDYYPVPWSAFETSGDKFVLDIDESNFKLAPRVDSMDIERLSSQDYRDRIRSFYSKEISESQDKSAIEKAKQWTKDTFGSKEEKPLLYEGSDILGLDVENLQGDSLADLEDFIIDDRQGNIAYGFVSYGGLLGLGEKTAAVPWSSLSIHPYQGYARINATKEQLDAAAIDKDDMEKLSQPEFARQVHDNFGVEPYWEVFGFVEPEGMDMSMKSWEPNSKYNKNFDPGKVSTYEGTIQSVGTFYPEKDAAPGTRLKVRTNEGRNITIYAGPQTFAKQKDFRFKSGSNISVTGSRTNVKGKSVIMASEIRTEGKTLKLRDNQGIPQWDVRQLQQK